MKSTRTLSLAGASLVAASLLLTGCGSSSTSAQSTSAAASAPAPASSAAATAAPAASGSPSAELTAWAGQVCTQVGDLKTSVTGLGTAVAGGGSDIGASVSKQFDVIKASTATLVTTVEAVPTDGSSSPEIVALKDSAAKTQASIDALGQSVSNLQGASGVGLVTALAGVGGAAKDAATAVGATVGTISDALKGGTGVLQQAFAASPSCTALKQ